MPKKKLSECWVEMPVEESWQPILHELRIGSMLLGSVQKHADEGQWFAADSRGYQIGKGKYFMQLHKAKAAVENEFWKAIEGIER